MYISPFQSYGGLKKLERSLLLILVVQDTRPNIAWRHLTSVNLR